MRAAMASLFSWRTLLSGLAFAWVEGLYWNWATGLSFTLLIYLHEAGHVLVARWRGVRIIAPPTFLPGLGAFVAHEQADEWCEVVWIALGGPVIGGLAAFLTKLVGLLIGSPALAYAGDLALWINLVNLAPLSIFDGSRVMRGAGPLRFISLLGLLLASLLVGGDPFLLAVALPIGLYDLYTNARRDPGLPLTEALIRTALHLSAVALLALALTVTPGVASPALGPNHDTAILISRLALLALPLLGLAAYLQQIGFPGCWLGQWRWAHHLGAAMLLRSDRVAPHLPRFLGLAGLFAAVRLLSRRGAPAAAGLAAAQGCRQAFSRLPWVDAHTWVHAVVTWLQRNDRDAAQALLQHLRPLDESLYRSLELLGTVAAAAVHVARSCLQMGRADAALPYARAAVIGSPFSPEAHRLMAEVLALMERTSQAEAHRQRAEELEPALGEVQAATLGEAPEISAAFSSYGRIFRRSLPVQE